MTDPTWPPAIGEQVRLERATATLEGCRETIERVSDLVIREIGKHQPGATIRSIPVAPERLAREVRDERRRGVVVEVVSYVDSNGTVRVIGVSLAWDGKVYVPRPLPWE